MNFDSLKDKIVLGLGSILVTIAFSISHTLINLNEKMAVIVEKVTRHDQQIRDLEDVNKHK